MADVRPVQFPAIPRPTEPAGKPRPVSNTRKVEKSPLQQIFTNVGRTQAAGHPKAKSTNQAAPSDPVEKAKAAMLKFYQPDKQAAKETAPLGQIIDVKA